MNHVLMQSPAVPARGVIVRHPLARNLLSFLMVVGPGLIVMEADNDAGAVSTYVQAGAQYGTHLLWLLVLLLPMTYFIQEMVVRLGIATGKGHAAMIYQRFGKWWGLFSLVDLQLVNFLTLVTEFAAIALALEQLHISPLLGVPVAAIGLTLLALTGSYRRWERIVVFLCLLDLAWFDSLSRASRRRASCAEYLRARDTGGGLTAGLVFLVIAIVGTTIAPWQLFFQQSCIADKRLRFADLKWARLDTVIGATFTILVAGCMMIAGNAALRHGFSFHRSRADGEPIWAVVFGPWFRTGILLLMINAAVLGTTAISLSSAWAYGEVKGWPHSLQLSIKTLRLLRRNTFVRGCGRRPGPDSRAPLQLIIVAVQVLAGVMLPSAIIFLQLLLNDKEMLGERSSTNLGTMS